MKVIELPEGESRLCPCSRKARLRVVVEAHESYLCWDCARSLCGKLNDAVRLYRYEPFRRTYTGWQGM